jgi:alpha-tubulin suppressor-like RCC1 family protein
VLTGGGLWCWGDNSKGQLGIGGNGDQDSPAAVILGSGTLAMRV